MPRSKPKPNFVREAQSGILSHLFGPTWWAWMVLFKCLFGDPLDKKERLLYRKCTGRRKPPKGPFRELWAKVGRRGGKSYAMSAVAVFLALFFDYSKHLSIGEKGVVQIVAADRSQARVIFNYIHSMLHSNPMFERCILNETKEMIELTTGVDIAIMTCSFRTIRGRTVVCGILDEVNFWRSDGANPAHDTIAAIRPAMATIPDAKLLVISSAYARLGPMYDTHQESWGKDDPERLCWMADTPTMNPNFATGPGAKIIERDMKHDPVTARREWFSEDEDNITVMYSVVALEDATVKGRRELPPVRGMAYSAVIDAAGGGGREDFAMGIGHKEGDKVIIDLVRTWKPPFNTGSVVAECVGHLRRYGIHKIRSDRYAGLWPTQEFQKYGIICEPLPKSKSELFLDFESILNTGQVELLDSKELFAQFRGLERKVRSGGRDTVDHGPRGKDDAANVVAAVSVVLSTRLGRGRAGAWPEPPKSKKRFWLDEAVESGTMEVHVHDIFGK